MSSRPKGCLHIATKLGSGSPKATPMSFRNTLYRYFSNARVGIFFPHGAPQVIDAAGLFRTSEVSDDAKLGLACFNLGHGFIHRGSSVAYIPGNELLLFQISRAIRHVPDGSRL